MEAKYLYEVHPSRIIRRPGKPPLRHPASMLLTKEEVLNIMDYGRVYRKPAKSIEAILVTGDNINQLHVEDSLIDLSGLTRVASEKVKETPKKEFVAPDITEIDMKEESVEEDEVHVKNSEEEALSVDGSEEETTVELKQEMLPEVKDTEASEERECDPTVVSESSEEDYTEEGVSIPENKEVDITVVKVEDESKVEVPAEAVVQKPQNKPNNVSFQSNGQNNYHNNKNRKK